jgi:hypothetical protein
LNLANWVHAATINEHLRQASEIPDAFPSLWTLKHSAEASDKHAQPVLLKAVKWLAQYLPVKDKYYLKEWIADPSVVGDMSSTLPDMAVTFPFHQKKSFYFDRMLEILRYGVNVYGVHAIFEETGIKGAAKTAYYFPLYSVDVGMHTSYASTVYESGTRIWPSLGIIAPFNKTDS